MDEWRRRMAKTNKVVTMALFMLLAASQPVWTTFGGPGSTLGYVVIACVLAGVVAWQLSMRWSKARENQAADRH
jgi:Zn-dependent protease with chaperone function